MQIDQAAARLAPRSPWQAMDMGGALFRAWWRPLLLIWLAVTLPGMALLLLLTGASLFWTTLLFWWLKPLWERPLLAFMARAMFGGRPGTAELLRGLPRYGRNGLLASLTWRRLSPARSFNLPVFQLEQSRGQALRDRLRILHMPPGQHAGTLTILMLHLEQMVALALLVTLYVLLPWQVNIEFLGWIEDSEDSWKMLLCWYLAMCLTQPMYVACGFALYLNKRTWLEGWDMETGLRRIAARRKPASAALLALLLLPLFVVSPDVHAAQPAREQAIDIVAGEDFMAMEVRTQLRFRDSDGDSRGFWEWLFDWMLNREASESDWQFSGAEQWMAGLRVLMWLLMAAALLGLLWKAGQRYLPDLLAESTVRPAPWQPAILRQPLPDNIADAVKDALARDDRREAISLLYRAWLRDLTRRYRIVFPEGATEQECLHLVGARAVNDSAAFTEVANLWMATAWAHRPAEPARIESLLTQWQSLGNSEETD